MAARRKKRQKNLRQPRITRYRSSMIFISCILLVLAGATAVHGVSLRSQMKEQSAQISKLEKEKKTEQEKAKEIEKYKEYVGTDEYVEDTARDKLGMAKENEILFKPEE
ncbi:MULTISPECIES: septum formation initiator family protein [Sellimonas]|uniref:Septum formation initiator family protein n=1 Tax=Sellimonas caecigallum TaxID=2592333 RepID=A0ABS7L872_9FIRM|nr:MULTISPECIES: septum formation initiator family protein [Sellimonas]MBY0759265.1 septum formation initiator family protein [Sellimonas caecigallum]OUP00377.1 hypothetical protein B5F37_11390 [Drancourtella sp. An210]OUP62946.1 hypothetical protein B5F13_11885 [Drancourtella sp. An177]